MMTAPTSDRSTRREDLLTLVFGTWTMVGLAVDAYSHSTDPGLESFWTPWHALFYSGFAATAIWLIRMAMKRSRPGVGVLDWAPAGYRHALIGLAIFAVGGAGDAVWHSVFGVETSIDALLSPTHLLLFVGLLMILAAPLRAAWTDPEIPIAPTVPQIVGPLLSMMMTTTLVAFFLTYIWFPNNFWFVQEVYVPETNSGAEWAILGIAGVLLTNLVLTLPVIILTRRWTCPTGVIGIIWSGVNIFMMAAFDELSDMIFIIILAAFVADLIVSNRRWPRLITIGVPPLLLWSGVFGWILTTSEGIGWPIEIWTGVIVLSMLSSIGIDLAIGANYTPLEEATE